jgi:Mn2+/Fe2+ NRAMP family transporter
MTFFFVALVLMYLGRKIGWALSRNLLHTAPIGVAVMACLVWGALVAFAIYSLIQWQHPGLILKIVMGYLLGAYVSVPNFGLVLEGTIPSSEMPRHNMISLVPPMAYVISCFGFAYL